MMAEMLGLCGHINIYWPQHVQQALSYIGIYLDSSSFLMKTSLESLRAGRNLPASDWETISIGMVVKKGLGKIYLWVGGIESKPDIQSLPFPLFGPIPEILKLPFLRHEWFALAPWPLQC